MPISIEKWSAPRSEKASLAEADIEQLAVFLKMCLTCHMPQLPYNAIMLVGTDLRQQGTFGWVTSFHLLLP